mmetsp:Transcript_836/g.1630  ORF Transcript_836/g.1630 Transcript_836/m.1630 type:complete len:287 (-) Transcript_836:8-868(-)
MTCTDAHLIASPGSSFQSKSPRPMIEVGIYTGDWAALIKSPVLKSNCSKDLAKDFIKSLTKDNSISPRIDNEEWKVLGCYNLIMRFDECVLKGPATNDELSLYNLRIAYSKVGYGDPAFSLAAENCVSSVKLQLFSAFRYWTIMTCYDKQRDSKAKIYQAPPHYNEGRYTTNGDTFIVGQIQQKRFPTPAPTASNPWTHTRNSEFYWKEGCRFDTPCMPYKHKAMGSQNRCAHHCRNHTGCTHFTYTIPGSGGGCCLQAGKISEKDVIMSGSRIFNRCGIAVEYFE